MIISYADEGTKDIAEGRCTAKARRTLPAALYNRALRRLSWLEAAVMTMDLLHAPNSYHVEKLKGDRAGQLSIRINAQYRICFRLAGQNATDVEICDYH